MASCQHLKLILMELLQAAHASANVKFIPPLVTVDALPPEKRQLCKITEKSDTTVDSTVAVEPPLNELKLQTCAPMTTATPPP